MALHKIANIQVISFIEKSANFSVKKCQLRAVFQSLLPAWQSDNYTLLRNQHTKQYSLLRPLLVKYCASSFWDLMSESY